MSRTNAYSGTNAQHNFSQVPKAEHPRSVFNRSSNYKTTFNEGKLIPIYLDQDILPGDTVNLSTSLFGRLATPIYPLMDQLFVDTFWFFIPNRLVWDKWAYFLGEEETPGDAQSAAKYTTPQITLTATKGTMPDYFGLPIGHSLTVSALPFRAYNLLWSEWFRDESLQLRPALNKGGGVVSPPSTPETLTDYPLRARGRRKDYVTGSLPWPQKGPTVLLPLGSSAPVTITPSGAPTFQRAANVGSFTPQALTNSGTALDASWGTTGTASGRENLNWATTGLTATANLAGATSATINELRQSFQVQRLLERDARGGSRLTELVKSHFGVTSPDSRLQRPEFLGGSSTQFSMNPVPQTNSTNGNNALGDLAAYATMGGGGGRFSHSFTEHGILMCLASVRAPLNYQNFVHKSWKRKTRFDHYWPALQALGEQAVLQYEVYANGLPQDNTVWGYQERWSEYRFKPNIVTSDMRSGTSSLDAWHLALDFGTPPALNSGFIEDVPPLARVVAVPSEPRVLLDAYFECKHSRVMPVYSVPGMIDHF